MAGKEKSQQGASHCDDPVSPTSRTEASNSTYNVQEYVTPYTEDAVSEDANNETHPTAEAPEENGSVAQPGDEDQVDEDTNNDERRIDRPRMPANLHSGDFASSAVRAGALMPTPHWAHCTTHSKLGSAVQNVLVRVARFKDALESAVDRLRNVLGHNLENVPLILKKSAEEAVAWVKENPKTTALIVVCVVGVAIPIVVVAPALAVAGFGAGGVAAGSLAAGVQASIGASVAAGSLFATLTSAGAGGAGLVAVCGAVQVVAGAGLASAITAAVCKAKAIEMDKKEHDD